MPPRAVAPYGTWQSPVSASMVASAGTSRGTLEELRLTRQAAYWVEIRPEEGGRSALIRWTAARGAQSLLLPEYSACSRLHEYGGGSLVVTETAQFFVNFRDQRMYRLDPGRSPYPITPEPDEPASLRYADGEITPDGRHIVAVREQHRGETVVNDLALISTTGEAVPRSLLEGHDFFAFPRLHPNGKLLAWTTWDHPNMPWQGSRLWVAGLESDGRLSQPHRIAGGDEESIFQPSWSPDGRLHFVSDRSGWWNLYALDSDGSACLLLPIEAEVGLPQWGLGFSRYVFLPGGEIACLITREGMDELCLLSPNGRRVEWLPTGLTCCYPPQLRWDGTHLWMIGGSPSLPQSIVRFDVERRQPQVVHCSITLGLDAQDVSRPEHFTFKSAGGRLAHAFYYPPRSRRFRAPIHDTPPLLVASHGGPTSAAHSFLLLWIQYWTSRGLAVVDVNYGGSSGYGRGFRDLLRGQWGVVDVEDCVQAAVALANQGRADGNRLIIRGGSAGGFTTLSALAFFRVFSAAASYYGVADLELLARDTHKFEAHYLDWLIGPYPQAKALYRARSPIHHLDRFLTPVILFQGEDDRVVPPSQAEALAAALSARRIPHLLMKFAGEGHGFRNADNLRRCYQAELSFYSRILGFPMADALDPIPVLHLDPM
ncbi:MAG: prolyl oligopeptidase family serine peptidase [Anaerolineales bacterium]|nr:prolyl oligopeptidase family serine peptidase [Anaerolineales bacterium]